jgi:hypothetical protein
MTADGVHEARVALCGGAAFLLGKKEGGDVFERRIARSEIIGPVVRGPGAIGTEYRTMNWQLGANDLNVFLFGPELSRELASLDGAALDALANKKDERGKILAANNFARFAQERKVGDVLTMMKLGSLDTRTSFSWTYELAKDVVAKLGAGEFQDADTVVLEAGHVHADRALGDVQRDGILLGRALAEQLERVQTTVRRMTMIDEYHVINRIDYSACENDFESLGFPITEIALESSPIMREIATDILKRFLSVQDPRYKVEITGGNIYVSFSDGRGVVELIQDYEGRFILGCVLFDAAFCVYKRHKEVVQKLYAARHGFDASYDPHQAAVGAYKTTKDIAERGRLVKPLMPVTGVSWKEVQSTKKETPYLDVIAGDRAHRTALVNVLESFYRPQQAKLNRLLDLLDEERLYSLYFDGRGQVELEQTDLSSLRGAQEQSVAANVCIRT